MKPNIIVWMNGKTTFIEKGWKAEEGPEGLMMVTPSGNTATLHPWHLIKRVEYRRA